MTWSGLTFEAISLKFGMWSTEGGGSIHSKNSHFSSRQHRATEVRKLRFLSSSQYTHGCCAPASWAARHTTVCLDLIDVLTLLFDSYKGLQLCLCGITVPDKHVNLKSFKFPETLL